MAASLAGRGFDSRADVIECPQGFAATQSSDFNVEAALADPPGGYHMRANLFKYHAACYLTHAAIECAGRIRKQAGFNPDSVREITVRVNPGCDTVCNIAEPKTGLESKFSLRMTTAFALASTVTGRLSPLSATQTPRGFQERGVVALLFSTPSGTDIETGDEVRKGGRTAVVDAVRITSTGKRKECVCEEVNG